MAHQSILDFAAGPEVVALVRSNPRLGIDEETGEQIWDQESLTSESFSQEIKEMGEVAFFLNRVYVQLMHRYPTGGR